MRTVGYMILLISIICVEYILSYTNNTITSEDTNVEDKSVLLSRRKRFLIFPDGSSFQVVFCTQNHGYLQLGNIVWFGSTAALAWELPTDPEAFDMFRDRHKVHGNRRRTDVLYYVDEDGKVIDKIEYKRKFLINPAFAKRSIDVVEKKYRKITKADIMEMHDMEKNKTPYNDLDATQLNLHRKERQKLYAKLEKILQTLGWNGKECILKLLCETGRIKNKQGTFVEEIKRAIFTLPKVPESKSKVHAQYDDAHGANEDCAQQYPECGDISIE